MAAGAHSNRNKALDENKERAAGRRGDRGPAREAILDAGGVVPGKGKGRAGGAHGKGGRANRKSGNTLGEGGGGGGGQPSSDIPRVSASTRPARKKS